MDKTSQDIAIETGQFSEPTAEENLAFKTRLEAIVLEMAMKAGPHYTIPYFLSFSIGMPVGYLELGWSVEKVRDTALKIIDHLNTEKLTGKKWEP